MKILAINCKPDLTYFTSRGLTFDIDYKTTTQVFPYFLARAGTPPIYTPDVRQYLTQFTGYQIIIVGWNPKDYPTSFANTGGYTHDVPINGAIWCTVRLDQNTNGYIVHEMMHSLVYYLNVIKGLNKSNATQVMDYMDRDKQGRPYFLNNDPENPLSNHSQTWEQIKPHLDLLTTPTVTIARFSDDGVQTLGDLTYKDFHCKTLERPWKNNQRNISCIPKGTYKVKWTFKLGKFGYCYEIQNVPNRAGILIHSGNYFYDVEGCILLGTGYNDLNHDKFTDIINSKITVQAFNNLMGKKDFTLIIK